MGNSEAAPSRRGFLGLSAACLAAGLVGVRAEVARALASMEPSSVGRGDYSLDPAIAYLNHGSVGTVPRVVQEARRAYLETCERNPAQYAWGELWTELREEVRGQLASFLSCAPGELAITHNTTEGFNVLAQGLPLGSGDEILFSSLNHSGASLCWEHQSARRGYQVRQFEMLLEAIPDLTADEVIDLHLREIRGNTRMLVLPHVDNKVGLRMPVKRLAAAARRRGVEYVSVDGAQAVGMIPVDLSDLGVDFYATSPHKWLQSPKGLGLFYVNSDRLDELWPMWTTWGQRIWAGTARIFEDYGTRNLPEALSLGDAVAFHRRTPWAEREEHLSSLRQRARERAAAHPRCTFASPTDPELACSLYSVNFSGGAETVSGLLADAGVVVRVFEDGEGALIRISPNLVNREAEIDRLFDALPA